MQIDPARLPCAHLRAKAMYAPSGTAEANDGDDEAAVCWCNRTLRELGPDGEPAETAACRDTARVCYQTRAGLKRPT